MSPYECIVTVWSSSILIDSRDFYNIEPIVNMIELRKATCCKFDKIS